MNVKYALTSGEYQDYQDIHDLVERLMDKLEDYTTEREFDAIIEELME